MRDQLIRVLYLHREVEGSTKRLSDFIKSLNMQILKDPLNFFLCVIVKGPSGLNINEITTKLKQSKIKIESITEMPDDGFDLGAYYRASKIITPEPTLFLNSYSRFRNKNALQMLSDAWNNIPDDSILGTSGSFHCHLSKRPLFLNFRSLLFLPFSIYWNKSYSFEEDFPSLPNPHIRTTGFICNSSKLNQYFNKAGLPRTKRDCYGIELGKDNLTNFFNNKYILSSRNIHTVDKVVEGGFRNQYQQNLLISDNNSDYYDNASIIHKKILSYKSYF